MADALDGRAPVFVLTLHRSGGTALTRLLNCHPGLCIWGEHGGLINQLAEIDQVMGKVGALLDPVGQQHRDAYVAGSDAALRRFDPWHSPVSRHGFRAWVERYIVETFAEGVPAGRRWGFKEIRYHWPATVALLGSLFPTAQFVLLEREVATLCVSNMLAEWSVDQLRAMGVTEDATELRRAVEDCVYAIQSIRLNFRMIERMLPQRTLIVSYEQLTDDLDGLMDLVFGFLKLPLAAATRARAHAMLAHRDGVTPKTLTHGKLSRALVERLLPEADAAARAALLRRPPDRGRLLGYGAQGKYSFLVGDHGMRGSGVSSMF